MLEILRHVEMSPEQWDIVIEGMRNPKNSWERSDSFTTHVFDPETMITADFEFFLGENDFGLMDALATGGPVHAKYRRMMPVWLTINAPLYWWKEFDTYKVGTVANSCSTMHKIHAKEFELKDFSYDHISVDYADLLYSTIDKLNENRELYLKTKEKKYWWNMIQLLPTCYNQRRTVMVNYEVLTNIYEYRRFHKLDEWHVFCRWIETLPYSELITRKGEKEQA